MKLLPPPPFGWRYLKVEERRAWIALPLWLYWPVYFGRYWRTYLYQPLIALGFWWIREGDYYVNGRWSWYFWETLQWRREFHGRPWRGELFPASRWERVGRWCATRWDATMPKWTT